MNFFLLKNYKESYIDGTWPLAMKHIDDFGCFWRILKDLPSLICKKIDAKPRGLKVPKMHCFCFCPF